MNTPTTYTQHPLPSWFGSLNHNSLYSYRTVRKIGITIRRIVFHFGTPSA